MSYDYFAAEEKLLALTGSPSFSPSIPAALSFLMAFSFIDETTEQYSVYAI